MIVRQEGIKALWTGTTPNIMRNSVVNAAELATYDQAGRAGWPEQPRWCAPERLLVREDAHRLRRPEPVQVVGIGHREGGCNVDHACSPHDALPVPPSLLAMICTCPPLTLPGLRAPAHAPILQIKQVLMHSFGFKDNVYCHLASSLCAGFIAVSRAGGWG